MKKINKNLAILLLSCFCVLSISMVSKRLESNPFEDISMIVSTKGPSAVDKTDGQIKITVKGGKAPYKLVVITSTRTKELVYTGESFDLKDLPKGFYLLNISDSENHFTSKNINL